jgi:hypothetical protein
MSPKHIYPPDILNQLYNVSAHRNKKSQDLPREAGARIAGYERRCLPSGCVLFILRTERRERDAGLDSGTRKKEKDSGPLRAREGSERDWFENSDTCLMISKNPGVTDGWIR